MVLIAFSRNYLGVHTPQDILVGIAVGLLVMWLTYKLTLWLKKHPGVMRYNISKRIYSFPFVTQ